MTTRRPSAPPTAPPRRWPHLLVLLTFLFLTLLPAPAFAAPAAQTAAAAAARAADWKGVEEAIQKGLPRTAITNLDRIIPSAVRDQAYGEAAKAIARKIVLEGNIQGNKPDEKIVRLEAEIARAPAQVTPLLRTLQANWYWHYFQNNRWRFLQRTATAEAPGKDFTTWDLPRLFAEIDRQFSAALAAPALLQRTPVTVFDDLLERGSLPDRHRPTLYDFISHEALKFYTSGEQAAAKAEDAFEVSSDTPILAHAPEFLTWAPATTDTNAPALRAIRLFQQLLQFHAKDTDVTAYVDADLARLEFGHRTAFGETRDARYIAALKAIADQHADHELSAVALHQWARLVQADGNPAEARRLALRGVNAHRNTPGGRLCYNLVQEIEARSASLSIERVWNAPFPEITVRYRNVTNLWLRAVAWPWEDFLEKRRNRPESLNDQERTELLAKAAALAWSAPLTPTSDFLERTATLPAPATLAPGFYFLIASFRADFGTDDNQLLFTDFWVSDLAMVVRPREGRTEGFVLEANSGEPVAGATIDAWFLDQNATRTAVPAVQTDENGFFTFGPQPQRGYLLRARHKGRELASQQEYWSWKPEAPRPNDQTVFFTDRALYRPGQTIQYKGIAAHVDQAGDRYEPIAGKRIAVVFADPNGKEVARAEHQSNDHGSFSGSFTAPRDRLAGAYSIRVTSGQHGQASVRVEEYKRPKFQVKLEAPKEAARLGGKTVVPGKAENYTGAAVDGAQVRWRVVREVRWPAWWGWFRSARHPAPGGSQEIAHGTTRTGTDGSFQIEFIARPDPKAAEKDEPTFSFTVHADVTDTTGETRSDDRSVNVGFAALAAGLSAGPWQTDTQQVALTITTRTLDGEPQAAEGSVKIHRLRAPDRVQRPRLDAGYYGGRGGRGLFAGENAEDDRPDLSDPSAWELADVAAQAPFTTDAQGRVQLSFPLPVGLYRAILETQDRFGKKVTSRLPLQVLQPAATKLALRVPSVVAAPQWSVEPGETFTALWGTGYDTGRAFVEIEHRGRFLQRFWTTPGRTQQLLQFAVEEAQRGGFTLHVTQVRENRAHLTSRHVDVPWSHRELELKWEHFTSKLGPGKKETWTAVITGPKATRAAAELVASLYDASLDQFQPHEWTRRFGFFRHDQSSASHDFLNQARPLQLLRGQWRQEYLNTGMSYRQFPGDLVANFWGYEFARRGMMMRSRGGVAPMEMEMADAAPMALAAGVAPASAMASENRMMAAKEAAPERANAMADKPAGGGAGAGGSKAGPDLGQVTARRNLNETAFFFPRLLSDSNGIARLEFTMPEALTEWRFLGFAHDRELRSGFLQGSAVTSKDLMVQPNPPRFLREGDVLEFTVKVSNQSAARQQGQVRLSFTDAATSQPYDRPLGLTKADQAFDIPARESRSFSWRIRVPDGAPFLAYKAVAATSRLSDGEEGNLPVLARRIFVTESLPLPIRGQDGRTVTKKFEFEKLARSGRSGSLVHQNLVVQMVSNPSWYAVMALPYLMEFPHECSEQTFNRLYANVLARHIASSDPKIRRVFDLWKGTPALDSPLEKNQDLKSVMIEETPWLRQAQNESQARRNVGILFDENRLNDETGRTLARLTELQLADGQWPWFPGGRGNEFITLYITTGFGRLRHLGVDLSPAPAVRALRRLDTWMVENYERIQKYARPEEYVPSSTDALYLYGRSFFLKDRPIAASQNKAIEFFLARAREHWLKVPNRQSQGHLALALHRWAGDANRAAARDIMKSIRERGVTNEEMGMFWRETELSWFWHRAPIETQALMIEAFDEVMGDTAAVEECRVWLLKQKQTQDWKTTKATADAVYALLLRGRDILASDALVEMKLGAVDITPRRATPPVSGRPGAGAPGAPTAGVEAGTGFYEKRFTAAEIKPALASIQLRKSDPGVAWGSVHWQYLEDMSKITPHEGTPLKLRKSLFTKVNTRQGPRLEAVKGALAVGDELVVRLELRVDRDLEYVHLKDQRGSGTEPVNVLSRYRYQDGLAYYETTRDTASHFFIDYLPKGTYVFEYSTRVQHRGQYQTGLAEIQCMYAPEFNSHSESLPLTVR